MFFQFFKNIKYILTYRLSPPKPSTPKIDAARGAGAISVTRTLIYLILKYYTVEKNTKIPYITQYS